MARARNIKPGFYKNAELVECSVWARLIFPGLWMLADREGRLEDRPKQIKMELLPADQQEVEPLLQELEARGFLVRYRNDGGRFIQICNFYKHQTPHFSEKPSVIKPPDSRNQGASSRHDSEKEGVIKPPDSESPPGNRRSSRGGRNPLNPDSLNPDSGFLIASPAGEDGGAAQSATPPTAPPTPPPTPPSPPPAFDGLNAEQLNGKAVVALAEDFDLPAQWGLDAEALGFKPAEVHREAEKFRQFFVAGRGAGTRRSVRGWRQSWSNWLGKAAKEAQR